MGSVSPVRSDLLPHEARPWQTFRATLRHGIFRRATLAAVLSLVTSACALGTGATRPSGVEHTIAPLVDRPVPHEVAADLQAVIDSYARRTPSASAAVIVPGKGVWAGAAGMAETRESQAATIDTDYAIGSITKTFVAALTVLLARDRVLHLDNMAAQWLDERAAAKANGATIRQLLEHRSGIANFSANDAILEPGRHWTPAEELELIGEPDFRAGERYEYSNSNYLLLGLIDERAGRAPIEVQLRDRLLMPYGLHRTFFGGREPVPPPIAHGYARTAPFSGDLYDASGALPNASLASAAWAAGAMASTPSDIARWLYNVCSDPAFKEQMLPPAGKEASGLGIDQVSFPELGLVDGHVGATYGYVALGFFKRETCMVVVVMTNTDVDDLYSPMADMFGVAARYLSAKQTAAG